MFKLNLLAFLLIGGSVFSFKLQDSRDECCETKTVGDSTYELVKKMDTSGYDCISNCVYKSVKGNSSSSFCFKRGDLPVTCEDEAFLDICPKDITDGIKTLLPKIKEAITIISEIEKIVSEIPIVGPKVDKLLTPILNFLKLIEKGLEEVQKFCDVLEIELSICPDAINEFLNEAIPLVEDVFNTIEEIKKIVDEVPLLGPEVDPLLAEIKSTVEIAKTVLDAIKKFCDILG